MHYHMRLRLEFDNKISMKFEQFHPKNNEFLPGNVHNANGMLHGSFDSQTIAVTPMGETIENDCQSVFNLIDLFAIPVMVTSHILLIISANENEQKID